MPIGLTAFSLPDSIRYPAAVIGGVVVAGSGVLVDVPDGVAVGRSLGGASAEPRLLAQTVTPLRNWVLLRG